MKTSPVSILRLSAAAARGAGLSLMYAGFMTQQIQRRTRALSEPVRAHCKSRLTHGHKCVMTKRGEFCKDILVCSLGNTPALSDFSV